MSRFSAIIYKGFDIKIYEWAVVAGKEGIQIRFNSVIGKFRKIYIYEMKPKV